MSSMEGLQIYIRESVLHAIYIRHTEPDDFFWHKILTAVNQGLFIQLTIVMTSS